MFMPDAINATIDLMEAKRSGLTIHSSYNLGGISLTPAEMAREIKKHIPEFTLSSKPDFRQQIADSWPQSIDDSISQRDWGCSYRFNLPKITEIMLKEIGKKMNKGILK